MMVEVETPFSGVFLVAIFKLHFQQVANKISSCKNKQVKNQLQ